MKYENTQKGNPHKLVVNQHIFPAKSIQRFVNKNGFVEVFYKQLSKKLNLKPNNQIFCAKRAWDQRAELGYMKEIEDAFQSLVVKIMKGEISSLGDTENKIASEFLALWDLRHSHYTSPIGDIELIGIHPGNVLTQNEEEILEKKGYIVCTNKNSTAGL